MQSLGQQLPVHEPPEPLRGRILQSIGIHGKLIISFMLLLVLAISGSCWVFVHAARDNMNSIIGQHVSEMASTLAIAGCPGLAKHDVEGLNRLANRLIKSDDLLTIAFFDRAGRPLVVACRDSRYLLQDPQIVPHVRQNEANITYVQHRTSSLIGEYAEVITPVFQARDSIGANDRLVGYVQLNIPEEEQINNIEQNRRLAIAAGGLVLLLVLPVVSLLVHGILQPIGHLVAATRRLAAGDLHTQVDIRRSDMIGTLARSFNAMVRTIRQQQDELEGKVQQRTAELQDANKRLEREIAEKNEFLRAVSHDLNAPLRNISGMASMLLIKHKEKLDEDIVHRIERIQKNAQIETDLISELLELSRIKTRRQLMELVEIAGLVNEIRDVLEDDLRQKRIELIVETHLPTLYCERTRMRQLFQNLIDNAVKYMGESQRREIRIGCAVQAEHAEFYVRDTGIGIDADETNKIFTVFRRGKASAIQNIPGKGVGLAGVKSIVETYDGSVRVESQVGTGSTFFFTIGEKYIPVVAAPGANDLQTLET